MEQFFRSNLIRLFLIVLLAATGCNSSKDQVLDTYNTYKFDQKVIDKLPVYDSLAHAILDKIIIFKSNIDGNDAYQAFRYMPASYEPDVFKRLPQEVGTDIDGYFSELGKDCIYGFDVFKDSTIKIYIRSQTITNGSVIVEENLSYYPAGSNQRQREYPVKDTVLSKQWQYWARVSTESLF